MATSQSIFAHLQSIATDNKKLWAYAGEISEMQRKLSKLQASSPKNINLEDKEALRQSVLEHLYTESSKGNAQASDKLARLAGLGEETQDIVIEVVNYNPIKKKGKKTSTKKK